MKIFHSHYFQNVVRFHEELGTELVGTNVVREEVFTALFGTASDLGHARLALNLPMILKVRVRMNNTSGVLQTMSLMVMDE